MIVQIAKITPVTGTYNLRLVMCELIDRVINQKIERTWERGLR